MLPSHGVYSGSSPASFANCNSKEAITTLAQPAADTQSLRQTLDALFLDATPNYSRVFWTTLQITRILHIYGTVLKKQVAADLARKMVFLGGPRQVGKTTLAKQFLKSEAGYLNWDYPEHRQKILQMEFPKQSMLVLDELHKYRKWRNYLKGLYDVKRDQYKILVTGSARLDFYRFGGDSLQGRYHYLRLHPLSAAELQANTPADLKALIELGGF